MEGRVKMLRNRTIDAVPKHPGRLERGHGASGQQLSGAGIVDTMWRRWGNAMRSASGNDSDGSETEIDHAAYGFLCG